MGTIAPPSQDYPAPPPFPDLPRDGTLPTDLSIAWLNRQVTESEAFLAAQPGFEKIGASIDAIMSTDEGGGEFTMKSAHSLTRTNRISKVTEDGTAQLTDTKPFWDYTTANRRFEQQAQITSKLATFWYQQNNVDLTLGEVVSYAKACGTGYLHLSWDPESNDICAVSEDPRNVLPIRPKGYQSLEQCSGVIVKRRVPVSFIKDHYGVEIAPDSDGRHPSIISRAIETIQEVVSPIWAEKISGKADGAPALPRIPTIWLYTCYIKDNRRNTRRDRGRDFTNKPVEVGEFEDWQPTPESTKPPSDAYQNAKGQWRVPANNWSYLAKVGQALYPHRRMIVWAGQTKLYDGPMKCWSGCRFFPIIKLTLVPYPWSWLGKATVWDLLRLQTSLNRLLRIFDNHAGQVAHPGAILDRNNVSKATKDEFDTSRPGWKAYQNPLAGKGIQIVNPPPLDAAMFEYKKWLIDEIDTLAGTKDLSNLLTLGQLPSNSTVEAIINRLTPQLRKQSRILEAFHRNLATQLTYFFAQYYTFSFRVTILGPAGVVLDDFDYDPGSTVPDYIHDKDYTEDGAISTQAILDGPRPRYERAQEFLRGIVYKIATGSLLNSAQMERSLIYLQLTRAGIMDPLTLMEQLNIPNLGIEELPDGVRTVLQRIKWCQQNGLMMDVSSAGRKSSGQEPPKLRGDGKISESG